MIARQRNSLAASLAGLSPSAWQGLVGFWRHVIGVLQSATKLRDFFQKPATAVVEMVGLDLGAVCLRGPEAWRPAAIRTAGMAAAWGQRWR